MLKEGAGEVGSEDRLAGTGWESRRGGTCPESEALPRAAGGSDAMEDGRDQKLQESDGFKDQK